MKRKAPVVHCVFSGTGEVQKILEEAFRQKLHRALEEGKTSTVSGE